MNQVYTMRSRRWEGHEKAEWTSIKLKKTTLDRLRVFAKEHYQTIDGCVLYLLVEKEGAERQARRRFG